MGIGGVLAFEVIEQIRQNPSTKDLTIVLLASVFERTRYKRRPNNLYGADAYLELHHVPDRLGSFFEALQDGAELPDDRVQSPRDRSEVASLRTHGLVEDDDGRRSLARRLISDVALYHGDEIQKGVAEGEPLEKLAEAFESARQLYLEHGGAENEAIFDEEKIAFGERLLSRTSSRRKTED